MKNQSCLLTNSSCIISDLCKVQSIKSSSHPGEEDLGGEAVLLYIHVKIFHFMNKLIKITSIIMDYFYNYQLNDLPIILFNNFKLL